MSDEPTTMDWLLHTTRTHTPTEFWETRNSLEYYFSANADERLIKAAPKFREEVARLREGIWRTIKNAESAISAGSEHSEAFRFIAQELREMVE